ncbi:response regulator, partial [bacterium]|nr:response regulator [bacterium]
MGSKILIVEDDLELQNLISTYFTNKDLEVICSVNGKEALQVLEKDEFQIILTDWKMKVMDGMEFLMKARRAAPSSIIIMMTSYSSVEAALEAMEQGADSFISKPFKMWDLEDLINKIVLKREKSLGLSQELHGKYAFGIISKSQIMAQLLQFVAKIQDVKSTVLITGESGSGKEV